MTQSSDEGNVSGCYVGKVRRLTECNIAWRYIGFVESTSGPSGWWWQQPVGIEIATNDDLDSVIGAIVSREKEIARKRKRKIRGDDSFNRVLNKYTGYRQSDKCTLNRRTLYGHASRKKVQRYIARKQLLRRIMKRNWNRWFPLVAIMISRSIMRIIDAIVEKEERLIGYVRRGIRW